MSKSNTVQAISVIVPSNPFVRVRGTPPIQCLAALDVRKLMEWWPGKVHSPNRNSEKVRFIQRALDWKRVAQIAAYLLQQEITDAYDQILEHFSEFYEFKDFESLNWPPRLPNVVRFQPSEYPTFSNILVHVNGARIEEKEAEPETAKLVFEEDDKKLNFSIIDGQHRVNGAFLAVSMLRSTKPEGEWRIPAEVFLDLDRPGEAPHRQAQIFIDVNFYQKKVDRSLVADLFPTARGKRASMGVTERAQDLGRKLMLETGPLVGMVQIPGIRFGVKDVVTLATLNSAIEDVIPHLDRVGIESLEEQASFIGLCLDAWLDASGRREDVSENGGKLDPSNVAYQGRVIVSFMTLIPACLTHLREKGINLSRESAVHLELTHWLKLVMRRADLLDDGQFLRKEDFRTRGFLGSGGLARFRDLLWAATLSPVKDPRKDHLVKEMAGRARKKAFEALDG
jgi:DGQHR domain-containing protein